MTTVTPKTFTATDNLNAWADDRKILLAILASMEADSLNGWADDRTVVLGEIPIARVFSDALNFWDDSTLSAFFTLSASLPTDDFNAWDDALNCDLAEVVTTTPIELSFSDTMMGWQVIASGYA